jgi:hypothetical protein
MDKQAATDAALATLTGEDLILKRRRVRHAADRSVAKSCWRTAVGRPSLLARAGPAKKPQRFALISWHQDPEHSAQHAVIIDPEAKHLGLNPDLKRIFDVRRDVGDVTSDGANSTLPEVGVSVVG